MTYQIECGHCRERISSEDAMDGARSKARVRRDDRGGPPVPTIPAGARARGKLGLSCAEAGTQLLADAKTRVRAR